MANGINAAGRNKEWWGKRPLSCYQISSRSKTNKYFKRLLHKIERRNGKNDITFSCMNLSISSFSKEWDKEDNKYWDNY